jgi:pimeloyl-ACP methyl ester carboxylesterase
VIRRDARGYGKSSSPPKGLYDYIVDTIISEIVDTLDQLGLRRVHFLGGSTGGIFGQALAVKHPDRLLSLTTCSTPMYLPPAAQDWLAFGHSSRPATCRELGVRGWRIEGLKLLGTDQIADKAYLKWWIEEFVTGGSRFRVSSGLDQHTQSLNLLNPRHVPPRINEIGVHPCRSF